MKPQSLITIVLAASVLVPAIASAQHDHGAPAAAPAGVDPAQLAACVDAQRQTSTLVEAANARLEAARQTNQPSAMRSAMEDLQATLATIRARLDACTTFQAAAGAMAGHNMAGMTMGNMPGMVMPGAPNTSASPATAPGTAVMNPGSPSTAPAAAPPAAGDAHAGHAAAPPPSTATPRAAAPRAAGAAPRAPAPSAAKPAPPAATASPKMVMVMTALDPAKLQCPTKIDPKMAPKTTYQGKTYYFCSAKDRDEFLTDPNMSLSMRPPL